MGIKNAECEKNACEKVTKEEVIEKWSFGLLLMCAKVFGLFSNFWVILFKDSKSRFLS
jgi:hypothetical protein